MIQQERLNRALELVSERGNVTIAELGDALGVSAATVRRDLNMLADQRLVNRTHGGASALGSGYELPLQYKLVRQAEAKASIARATARLIQPGDVVGLNGGTTTSEVARTLGRSDRFRSRGESPGVTIVTNALNIAYELSVREQVRIVVTGGVPRRLSYELVGPLVASSLENFSIDVAILGVDGISSDFGATTIHEGEAEASRQIARASQRTIIVADSSKLGRNTFARISALSEIDMLVTNAEVPEDFAEGLTEEGVEILVADAA